MELKNIRNEIDSIDEQIVALFKAPFSGCIRRIS